ncbi:unnamed protein product, partial [Cylicostephanus goldi]
VTLQPVLAPVPTNGTKKSRLIQVEADPDVVGPVLADFQKDHDTKWTDDATNPLQFYRVIPMIQEYARVCVRTLLSDEKVLEQLKSENFDVGITELFDFSGFPVFEAIGLKNIIGAHSISSLMEGSAYAVGAPVIPSYMPASQGITDDSTSFSTRVKNIIYTYLSFHFHNSAARAAEEVMFEKLGKAATPIWDTVANMTWLLTNAEPLFEFAKPTLNKIDWNRILSLRSHTILISFGSVLRGANMPEAYKRSVMNLVKA